MQAVQITKWGSFNDAIVADIPRPNVQDKEVLIKVHAAGVNPIDYKICEGYFKDEYLDPFPFRLGWDVAGTIEEIGTNVKNFTKGQPVFGMVRFPEPAGTFAEYVTAPISDIAIIPQGTNFVKAASAPLAALTAWQALYDVANMKSNQRVLIHSAAGGVGHFAVQLAKVHGCEVIGTASADNRSWLKELGVSEVIDYKKQAFEKVIEPVDVVLDTIGGENARRSLQILKPNGTLITLPQPLDDACQQLADEKNIKAEFIIVKPSQIQLQDIATLIGDEELQPFVSKTFALSEFKEALKTVKSGHTKGKVVITV